MGDQCGQATISLTLALQLMLFLNVLVSIPLNVVPTRISIIRLLSLVCGERLANRCGEHPLRHLLTFILIASLAVIAMTLTAVADIISFLSGSIGTVIAFLLPFIFYKKSEVNSNRPAFRFVVLLILGLATIAGFSNVAILIISKATGYTDF